MKPSYTEGDTSGNAYSNTPGDTVAKVTGLSGTTAKPATINFASAAGFAGVADEHKPVCVVFKEASAAKIAKLIEGSIVLDRTNPVVSASVAAIDSGVEVTIARPPPTRAARA